MAAATGRSVGDRMYSAAMSVNVHGRYGGSLEETGAARYGRDALRGQFFEGVTGRALERWLAGRPDAGSFHLFHDLGNFNNVSGHGYGPMSLGRLNIDHLVLTGAACVMVDAKGTGAGVLAVNDQGRGVLRLPDGTERPEPWMDKAKTKAVMGVLCRVVGFAGHPVWVLPDWTVPDPDSITTARVFRYGAYICNVSEVDAGGLDQFFPGLQPPADLAEVAALRCHLHEPLPPRAGVAAAAPQGPIDVLRGERHPRAKLTEAILAECRALKAAGETERSIAKRFGVSPSTLNRALTGKTWRGGEICRPARPRSLRRNQQRSSRVSRG